MEIKVMLVGILVSTLIYLYIKQSRLIFQNDIKIAKTLTVFLLCIMALEGTPLSVPIFYANIKSTHYAVSLHSILFWVMSILIFWRILLGCQKECDSQKSEGQ